jgi:CubicO group peptidase (beta-lactamase class C family)
MRRRTVLTLPALLALFRLESVRGAQVATPAVSDRDLTGVDPLPLTGGRRAEFEAYIADALLRFQVPGAAVAVVQNGDVVYLNSFGVKEAGSTRAVDPDTMFMIGSITKPLTTLLASALVDAGRLTWDTPLVELLPDFAVGDADLTQTLSVRDAFCNCIGIPGRNIEIYFESAALTPDEVVTSLADTAPTAARGEQYQYNNLLIAAGGYALGAATGTIGDVGLVYDTALRQWVLGPIGMPRTTSDPEVVLTGGNYALPHAIDLSGELQSLSLIAERGVLPVRPSGALWSNAREMARFVQTELARGGAPDGTRVASAENVETTWEAQVAVPADPGGSATVNASLTGYGLGWLSGDYQGLQVLSHAGGSSGFAAELAFLPEVDLGIVVLSNMLQTSMIVGAGFPYAVQFRLFEILFEQPARIDAELAALADAWAARRPQTGSSDTDPAAVAPFLGRYSHPQLGEVTLALRGNRLVLDVGESASELRPRAGDDGADRVYLLLDPPLSFLSELGAMVEFAGDNKAPRLTVSMPASPSGPEQVFMFEPDTARG